MSDERELELFFSSPNRYEKLTIEVQLGRRRIAEINQENGVYQLEIELRVDGQLEKVPLDAFLDALNRARQLLVNAAAAGEDFI